MKRILRRQRREQILRGLCRVVHPARGNISDAMGIPLSTLRTDLIYLERVFFVSADRSRPQRYKLTGMGRCVAERLITEEIERLSRPADGYKPRFV
jgi:predicted ArsR family transcriptional regulator